MTARLAAVLLAAAPDGVFRTWEDQHFACSFSAKWAAQVRAWAATISDRDRYGLTRPAERLRESSEHHEVAGEIHLTPHRIETLRHVPVSVERYMRGEIGFEIHIGVWAGRADVHPEYFVIALQRSTPKIVCDDRSPRDARAIVEVVGTRDESERDCRRRTGHRMDEAMFVDVGKSGECSERIDLTGGSVVRLQRLNLVCHPRVDVLQEAVPLPHSGLTKNRELNIFSLVFGWLSSQVLTRELPPKMFQTATEVVQCIPDEQPPTLTDLRGALDAVHDRSVFRLILSHEGYRFQILAADLNYLGVKRPYVGLRPFELVPTAAKRIGHRSG